MSLVSVVACSDDDSTDDGHGGSSSAGTGGSSAGTTSTGGSHAGNGGDGSLGGEPHAGTGTEGGAGAGGAGGAGGDRSLGGAGGEFNGERETCGPYSLTDFCDAHPSSCPASPDEVPFQAIDCQVGDVERFASLCGGTVVAVGDHFISERTWTFDSAGNLVGVVFSTDVTDDCKDGGYSAVITYGTPCSPEGEAEDLCPGAGGAGGAGGSGG